MRKRRRPSKEARALRTLSRALERLERMTNPQSVPPVEGEPEWVERLRPYGKAFVRLLLEEATPRRKKRS